MNVCQVSSMGLTTRDSGPSRPTCGMENSWLVGLPVRSCFGVGFVVAARRCLERPCLPAGQAHLDEKTTRQVKCSCSGSDTDSHSRGTGKFDGQNCCTRRCRHMESSNLARGRSIPLFRLRRHRDSDRYQGRCTPQMAHLDTFPRSVCAAHHELWRTQVWRGRHGRSQVRIHPVKRY